MAITLKINGIDKLKNDLGKLNKAVADGVSKEIAASALNIEKEAKKLAPVNFGTLRRSINSKRIDKLTYKVQADVSYAAYMEFGTGGKVSIPAGYDSYAATFKGQKSGTYYDFLLAIAEWVKKKGLYSGKYQDIKIPLKSKKIRRSKSQKFEDDVKLAEAIAYSILKHGIRPQPFLIPAFQQEIPQLYKRLKELLNVKS
jgi:HK97 gp10 family phage protein